MQTFSRWLRQIKSNLTWTNSQDLELLQKVYKHVGSVDLIMGALAEVPMAGGGSVSSAAVGPTLACIIGKQEWSDPVINREIHGIIIVSRQRHQFSDYVYFHRHTTHIGANLRFVWLENYKRPLTFSKQKSAPTQNHTDTQ